MHEMDTTNEDEQFFLKKLTMLNEEKIILGFYSIFSLNFGYSIYSIFQFDEE